MATKKTVEVSVLRQRLLQFILEKKFKEYIGGDWWSKNLHPHMQDEAKNLDSKTGIAYGIVLRKYKISLSISWIPPHYAILLCSTNTTRKANMP